MQRATQVPGPQATDRKRRAKQQTGVNGCYGPSGLLGSEKLRPSGLGHYCCRVATANCRLDPYLGHYAPPMFEVKMNGAI